MPDKSFKQLERDVAALIGGKRAWANSGEAIDCEGPQWVAQVKYVKRLSLEELTQLAEIATAQGTQRSKRGLVAVKCKRGRGFPAPLLIVLTADTFRRILDAGKERP